MIIEEIGNFTNEPGYLHNYCLKYDYPEEAENALVFAAKEVAANKEASAVFREQLESYPEKHELADLSAALTAVIESTENLPVATETVQLLFFIFCASPLKELYRKANYTDAMFDGVMLDLRAKLFECKNVKGIWGSFVVNWFRGFFSLDRFAFGRLQYEIVQMSACISPDGKYCFNGETALNIHIPSIGPLLPEAVEASMQQAAKFFADRFEGPDVLFECNSWLLFPGHFTMLPETSNIRQFMDKFTLISSQISVKKAHLSYVFNTFEFDDLTILPRDTLLRRRYIERLEAKLPVGTGLGIRYMKKP